MVQVNPMANQPRDNWILSAQALKPELCDVIVKEYLKLPHQEGATYNNDATHRKSIIRWVNEEYDFKNYLMRWVHEANQIAFNVNITPQIGEMQFTEYSSEYKGEFKAHQDINWNNHQPFDRKLSMTIQLSDGADYDGGDFEFVDTPSPHPNQFRTKGSILVFPSYLVHKVSPVVRGTRYSLVCWISGPRWR